MRAPARSPSCGRAPLAVGDERRGEERQLRAVDGEERLGALVAERHDGRGRPERAEQRRQHGGVGERRVDGADGRDLGARAGGRQAGGEPRERPERRARGRARPRTQSGSGGSS